MVADAARCAGQWSGISFYDDRWPTLCELDSFPVVGNIAKLRQLHGSDAWPAQQQLVVALGNNTLRLSLSREFMHLGQGLATVLHPTAVISQSAQLAPGTVAFARSVVNPRSNIGLASIINTGAIVDHDGAIGEGVHLCPGVALAGNVTVEDLVTIGIGSCVIQGRRIGRSAFVGAGSVVIRDVEAGATVVGVPAARIHI